MFRIHNRRLFWRLAGRSIKANLGRNLLTALAVFLSTLMLFSIFTIGVNYFRNLQTMMDRLDGVTDAILHAPAQEQYEQVQATPGVEVAGIRIWIGQETIPGARGFEIPLQHWYYDEAAWEHQILPMLSDVVGTYPQDMLEVMMSIDTLKRLGIDNPEIGMTIHLTRDYQLSGWFTDYKSEDRVLRSESGIREIYPEFWGWDSCQLGVCWSGEETWDALQQISLTEAQYWVSTAQRSAVPTENIVGLLGFTTLLILVGGYLFVSNILSLAVQHDIRFYGMLKTLGTSPRQLRTLVRAKAMLAALAGLVPGMLAAMLLCLEVVPRALETLTNDNMSAMPRTVNFYPVIFLVAILFVALTVALSSWKPARLAGKISPMQALSYTGLPGGHHGKVVRRTGLRSMALHNVFRQARDTPVIFLTANDADEDVVRGFQMGRDDYVTKPFAPEVLRQRVLAVLRRTGGASQIIRYQDLELDLDRQTVRRQGAPIRLTATEWKLLERLARSRGRVLTRTMLLEQIWDVEGSFIDENTLSVHIRRLRQKLEPDPKNPRYVVTVFGLGYTFGEAT